MIYLLEVVFVSQKMGLERTRQTIRLKGQPYDFVLLVQGLEKGSGQQMLGAQCMLKFSSVAMSGSM